MNDFVKIMEDLTGFIANEQVASYNEGVDDMLKAIRDWMLLEGIRIASSENVPGESVPELLNEIKAAHLACSRKPEE
jgi:hypothetical protein